MAKGIRMISEPSKHSSQRSNSTKEINLYKESIANLNFQYPLFVRKNNNNTWA